MNPHSALFLLPGVLLAVRPPVQEERIGTLPLERAAASFAELETACELDGGKLWGVPIQGPVLLVDPASRRVAGNQADPEGLLEERSGVFVGTLPADQPIANAPIEWAGQRWAMVMVLFLGETREERVTVLAHESFHRVQPQLGLFPFAAENEHLDSAEGRVWMQLEWNALEAALLAEEEDERRFAVRDALDFRAMRRARFPESPARENAVEIREGLANYTGLRIAARTPAQVVEYVRGRRAREDGFVRSFAYNSGPLYGYLLDAASDSWRAQLNAEADLGALLAVAMRLEPSVGRAEENAAKRGAGELRAREEERARVREARLTAWRASLVDGPVLILDLSQVTSGTMDTRKVHPFDEGRTVYTERKLIARWGTLEVSDGAILEDSRSRRGRISLEGAAADRRSGPGWKLELGPGWTIAPGEREGDFELRPGP